MSLKTKIEPIDRDIELMLSEELSPKAQAALFAEFAGEAIEEAKQTNKTILGRLPRHTVTVDGREGAPLSAVTPSGIIIVEFELINEALIWIAENLEKFSPVGSAAKGDPHPGLYKSTHILFADGQIVDVGQTIPVADEYVFINPQEYARPIERGSSSQAPDGVYQAVAYLAAQNSKFGNIALIKYEKFRGFVAGRAGNKSDNRNPAISVKIRGR